MVLTVYSALSPRTGCAPVIPWMIAHRCPVGLARLQQNLTPALGCQDHTLRPSATLPLVSRAALDRLPISRPAISCAHDSVASIAFRLSFRDDRDTPSSSRRDARKRAGDSLDEASEIFFARRLDRNSHTLPVGQITGRLMKVAAAPA